MFEPGAWPHTPPREDPGGPAQPVADDATSATGIGRPLPTATTFADPPTPTSPFTAVPEAPTPIYAEAPIAPAHFVEPIFTAPTTVAPQGFLQNPRYDRPDG